MADPLNPTPGLISQTLAKAAVQWRQLVGLLPAFGVWLKTLWANPWFDKPGLPSIAITKAQWDEIRDVAQSLPLTLLKLLICAGLVLNLCRTQIEATPTADPLDGAALVSTELSQIQEWYWLAALWLVCFTVEKVLKVVITVRATS